MDRALDDVVKERRAALKNEKKAKAAKAAKSKTVKKAVSVSKKTSPKKVSRPTKVISKPVKVVSRGSRNNGITSRLGGNSDYVKVMIMGLSRGISRGEIIELCHLVTKKVNVELFKPGSADIYCDNIRDAKALIKRFNGVTFDGRPMTLKLNEGDNTVFPSSNRGSNYGGRIIQKVVSRPSSRKGSRNDPPPRKTAPPKAAKKVIKKTKPVREREAPKSSEDLESEMKAYFAK